MKATVEARDPVPRWTDACPLPVLAFSLLLGLFGLMMVLTPLAYHGVAPCFGFLISGWAGVLFFLVVAALWGYAARAVYVLKPAGWWIALIAFFVLMVSNMITFSRVDLMEMYRLMGYPKAQMEMIKQSPVFNLLQDGRASIWMSLCPLPFLGYIVYMKKYFPRPKQIEA